MSTKQNKALNTVCIVLLFLAMGLVLYSIVNATNFQILCLVVLFCALVSAALYYLYGCRKDSAKYFKIFIYIYALSALLRVAGSAGQMQVDTVLAAALTFGAASVFAMALDLGRKKSLILGIVALAANLYILVRMLFAGDQLISLFVSLAQLVLAVVLLFMIIAKYEDKAERGSK